MIIKVKSDPKAGRVQQLLLKAENFEEEQVLSALADGIETNAFVHIISDELDVEFSFTGAKSC